MEYSGKTYHCIPRDRRKSLSAKTTPQNAWKLHNTDMRRISAFRSTTDRIYDGGPIRL
jgi:hypothetical protein